MRPLKERRKEPRIPCDERVRLIWTDLSGVSRWSPARCICLSASGLQVEIKEAIPQRAQVMFELENRPGRGTATVRYCRDFRMRYRAGMEIAWGEQLAPVLPVMP